MDPEQVLERRPVWTARQWDGTQDALAFFQSGLDSGVLTYSEEFGLMMWGQPVPDGAWLVWRDGWYDVRPDTDSYRAKYEPAPTEEPS